MCLTLFHVTQLQGETSVKEALYNDTSAPFDELCLNIPCVCISLRQDKVGNINRELQNT